MGVAPYVGAWIETGHQVAVILILESHPMWVRGLKLRSWSYGRFFRSSHPMWVRGLKLIQRYDFFLKYGRTLCGCVD